MQLNDVHMKRRTDKRNPFEMPSLVRDIAHPSVCKTSALGGSAPYLGITNSPVKLHIPLIKTMSKIHKIIEGK